MRKKSFGLIILAVAGLMVGIAACGTVITPLDEAPNSQEAVEAEAVVEAPLTATPTVAEPTPTPLQTTTLVPASPTVTTEPLPPTPTATLVVKPTVAESAPPVSSGPQTYVVKQFDTLLGIAVEFDTTVEALVAANGLNPNEFLQIDQELYIPAPGEVVTAPAADPILTEESQSDQTDGDVITLPDNNAAAQNTAVDSKPIVESNPAPAVAVGQEAVGSSPGQSLTVPPTPIPLPGGPPPVISAAPNINPLTGLPVDDPAKLNRRPLMVRIGNDAGARTAQVGTSRADLVYEEITEWWVTRFTAIFLGDTPESVGPIRSVRLVNVQLVPQYQGALAHSGGSDEVRWEISQAPLVNIDEFYSPAPFFYRPNEGWQTRLSLDTQTARNYISANGLEAAVKLPSFLFSDTIQEGAPAPDIYIPYPQASSFTEWHYEPTSGRYLRWIDGTPLIDQLSGQVGADNVIVYFAEHQTTDIVEDSVGGRSIRIFVNGSGPAWFFRDGKLNKGFWQSDGTRPPYFTFEDGRPYPLKPGKTWIQLVPTFFTIGLNSPDEAISNP